MPNSSAQSLSKVVAFASACAQALSDLAVKGGSARRASCIPSSGDPESCPATHVSMGTSCPTSGFVYCS